MNNYLFIYFSPTYFTLAVFLILAKDFAKKLNQKFKKEVNWVVFSCQKWVKHTQKKIKFNHQICTLGFHFIV
jgi:hypothetical protein